MDLSNLRFRIPKIKLVKTVIKPERRQANANSRYLYMFKAEVPRKGDVSAKSSSITKTPRVCLQTAISAFVLNNSGVRVFDIASEANAGKVCLNFHVRYPGAFDSSKGKTECCVPAQPFRQP